ncbi:MAG TPA: hypothetical protein VF510_25220 [Ktedonobacterales bacterium]
MSLPPRDMQAASEKTATSFRITNRDALLVMLLTLALSGTYLLIDIALDPALLPHAARAGRFLVMLILVGVGYFMSLGVLIEAHAKRSRVERTLNLLSILLLGPMLPIWSIVWLDPYLRLSPYSRLCFPGWDAIERRRDATNLSGFSDCS